MLKATKSQQLHVKAQSTTYLICKLMLDYLKFAICKTGESFQAEWDKMWQGIAKPVGFLGNYYLPNLST